VGDGQYSSKAKKILFKRLLRFFRRVNTPLDIHCDAENIRQGILYEGEGTVQFTPYLR
jgi:hypothetical protein